MEYCWWAAKIIDFVWNSLFSNLRKISHSLPITSSVVSLVDAENAFNKLMRKVSPENIKRLYVHPSTLVQQLQNSSHTVYWKWVQTAIIGTEEDITQGDNVAMAMYAISTPVVGKDWAADCEEFITRLWISS